jgi:phosphoenolpyruvate synthase/pyruvate phosphate dikinase
MAKVQKFSILVEDYNVPPHPWLFLNETFKPSGFKDYNKKLFIDNLFFFEKNKTLWGPKEHQFIACANFFEDKIQTDPLFTKKIIKDHLIAFRKIENFIKRLIKKDLRSLSNKELYRWYDEFQKLSIECFKPGIIIQYLEMSDDKMSDRVKARLAKSLLKSQDVENIFSQLITPNRQTYLYKEQVVVLKTIIKFQEDKEKWKKFKKSSSLAELSSDHIRDLKSLSRRFGWMQFYYDGQAADINYYYDLIKNYKTKPKLALAQKQKEGLILKREQRRWMKKLDAKLKKDILLLKEFSFLKEMRKEVQIYRLNWAMQKWWQELAKRLYTSATLTKYIMPDEIKDFLINEKDISHEELNKRYQVFAILLEKGKIKIYSGKKASALKGMFIYKKIQIKDKNLIKGSSAYPGKVQGKVKIVNSISDLGKFEEGDILVSFSTNPSLVPAMNKAAAIITNTGGITCHATIVSRELKKPCIIGTKIATKVLRDGDLVEVDANKGEVKIIKRK